MRLLALLLLTLALSARASSFSSDYSDLWWNQAESGWGVNIVQQSEVLFLTFFVYETDGTPTWYVGSDVRFQSFVNGVLTFEGALHETRGVRLGGSTSNRQVGTVRVVFNHIESATLTYAVDGVSTVKQLTRYTFRANDISGGFVGALIGTYTGCPAGNGYQEEPFVGSISQSGGQATIVGTGTNTTCTYRGQYAQAGRLGSINGTVSCANGLSGTFFAYEIEAGISGILARAQATFGGSCRWEGRFGGLRRG